MHSLNVSKSVRSDSCLDHALESGSCAGWWRSWFTPATVTASTLRFSVSSSRSGGFFLMLNLFWRFVNCLRLSSSPSCFCPSRVFLPATGTTGSLHGASSFSRMTITVEIAAVGLTGGRTPTRLVDSVGHCLGGVDSWKGSIARHLLIGGVVFQEGSGLRNSRLRVS